MAVATKKATPAAKKVVPAKDAKKVSKIKSPITIVKNGPRVQAEVMPVTSEPGGIRRGQARKGDGALKVNVPQDKPFGNTKGDRAWLEAQIDAGLIEELDADSDDDVAFGAMLRWTGEKSTEGSYWTLPPEGRRCVGKAKIRDKEGRYIVDKNGDRIIRPCGKWTIIGGTVCVAHGGGVEKVRAKARTRLAGAADALIGHLIAIGLDPNMDPKVRVQAINSALDRAGIKAGIDVQLSAPGWQDGLKEMFGDWDAGQPTK